MSKMRGNDRHVLESKLRAQREILAQATRYEHDLGVQKFHEIQTVQESHTLYHDREHLLYEDAIDKASAAVRSELATFRVDLDRLTAASVNFMSTGRFEREHEQLMERVESAFARVDEKIGVEERQTVRETTRGEVKAASDTGHRWLVGLTVASVISAVGVMIALVGLAIKLAGG